MAYENSNPDSNHFMIINKDGTITKQGSDLSHEDSEGLACTSYSNGNFSILFYGDDSYSSKLFNFSNSGTLLAAPTFLVGSYSSDGDVAQISGISGSSFANVYQSYETGENYLELFSKGVLEMVEQSSTEVRIYNHGSASINITAFLYGE